MSARMTTRTHTRLTDPFSEVRDLTGHRAIVTGGAGGIGVVITRKLAASGAAGARRRHEQ